MDMTSNWWIDTPAGWLTMLGIVLALVSIPVLLEAKKKGNLKTASGGVVVIFLLVIGGAGWLANKGVHSGGSANTSYVDGEPAWKDWASDYLEYWKKNGNKQRPILEFQAKSKDGETAEITIYVQNFNEESAQFVAKGAAGNFKLKFPRRKVTKVMVWQDASNYWNFAPK